MRGLAFAAAVCGAAIAVATAGAAAYKPRAVHFKGELRTDGQLTVGQQETVTLKRMPPLMSLYVAIAPPDDLNSCFDITLGTCLPTPLYPEPGFPPFRTSGKGRATLTFTMPRSYRFRSGSSLPEFQVPERPFRDQQVIWIRARGSRKLVQHGSKILARGASVARGIVEVPPEP